MKKYISFCIVGIVLLTSAGCKKNKGQADYSQSIRGTWELRYSEGGLLPPRNWATGNGYIIQFTDTAVRYYSAGQLKSSTGYTLVRDGGVQAAICNTSLPADRFEKLVYNVPYPFSSYISVSRAELFIYSGCEAADGSYQKYERLPGTSTAPVQ
jgi:hypothetical protein